MFWANGLPPPLAKNSPYAYALKIKIQYSMPSGFRLNHFATEKRAKPSPVKGSGDK